MTQKQKNIKFEAEHIPAFYRGGGIYLAQKPEMIISETVANPLKIIIVFDLNETAAGKLMVDDGETINSEEINFEFDIEKSSEYPDWEENILKITCKKSSDVFDYSTLRNFNLAEITIVNHGNKSIIKLEVDSKEQLFKQKLTFGDALIMKMNINLLKNDCQIPIVIKW